MSLESVLAAVTWPTITDSENGMSPIASDSDLRCTIIGYITKLYNGSSIASEILEEAALAGNLNFLEGSDGDVHATLNGHSLIALDFNEISNLYYFNKDGNLVHEIPELTVIHEIIHTLGYDDPLPVHDAPTNAQMSNMFDFDGDVVRLQDDVAAELGYSNNIQSNYYSGMLSSDAIFSNFDTSTHYTNGAHVDNVVIPEKYGAGNDVLDLSTSLPPDSADLIFGLAGDDEITGGGGADYLYGGAGSDYLDGGDGNDYLFGGTGDESYLFGGGGNDVIVGESAQNYLYGEDGNDVIWSKGAHASIGGDGGDDTIIMVGGSVSTYVTGGAGADTFRIDTKGSGPTHVEIADSDPTDQLIFNGYALTGGPMTVIDYESQTSNGNTTVNFQIAALDAHGDIYYRTAANPSSLVITLADGSTVIVDDFADGDFGLSVPVISNHYDANGNLVPGPYPYSNIANDGQILDYDNLMGRADATSTYGPAALPDHWFIF